MHIHPPYRPLAASTVAIVLGATLLFGIVPRAGSGLEGIPLALVQRAENAAVTAPVLWVTTDADSQDTARLRGQLARAVDAATRGGASAVVLAVPLAAPSDGADLARVRSFLDGADNSPDPNLRGRLEAWIKELDHDANLERALRAAGNAILLTGSAGAPLERFSSAARAVGLEPTAPADGDGVARRDRLYGTDAAGRPVPSLSFAAWLVAHPDRGADQPSGPAGSGRLDAAAGGLWIPHYAQRAGTHDGTPRATIADLIAGRVAPVALKDRVVVVGPDTPDLDVATGPGLSLAEATAQRIASLDVGSFSVVPRFARLTMLLALLFAIVWGGAIAPTLRPAVRVTVTALLAAGLIALELVLIADLRLWVPLLTAAVALLLATLAAALVPPPAAAPAARPAPITPYVKQSRPAPRPAPQPSSRAPALGRGDEDAVEAQLLPASEAGAGAGAVPLLRPPAAASLREIRETLDARHGEPTRAEVADLLLGRSKRPPKPKLGRYELERELGHGAMGTVYLGRDPRINLVVAVKAIPIIEEFSEEELAEARARFFREAEMAGRLKHPGIVTVHDVGEDGGIAWIAMEYVQGEMLSHHVSCDRLLPATLVMDLVARIADALDYAHAQDVVHRDIKPANVLFEPASGAVKITDFGIARLTNSSATRTGIVLGTPSFMAPEQLEGRNVTGRSDLFALGVTLFQLLAGQLPFRADSMTALMDKIANAPHPPIRTIRPDLPPCVSSIVDRALQKDPADRYATAGEMATALRACAQSMTA